MVKKVSLVVSDLSGGGAVRAFLLGQVLMKLNYTVEVVGYLFGKELYAIPPAGIDIVSIPGKKYPQLFTSIPKFLKQINGEVIYAVKPKPTSFGLSLLKRLLNHRPVLLDMDDWEMSWHGGDSWSYRPGPKQLYRDLFKENGQLRFPDHPLYIQGMERLVSHADAITVDTQFLQQRFGGAYLANGKDTDLFNPDHYDPDASRAEYQLSDYRVLMFPGAPRPHKGVEDVLKALEILNQPDLRVVVVGGSPYDDYDDRLQQQWGRWLIKLPRCPVDTMPKVVAAAHVVVVPQRNTLTAQSQFPLKLTDGMAMAKPVLSTRIGDIPEILGETGYLVDPESPNQIAETIQQIFQDWPAAEQRGRQARQRCIDLYSVQSMAPVLSQVLSTLKV